MEPPGLWRISAKIAVCAWEIIHERHHLSDRFGRGGHGRFIANRLALISEHHHGHRYPARPTSPSSMWSPIRASYVDWPAIIAGTVLASAISFVLFAFGAALGLVADLALSARRRFGDHLRASSSLYGFYGFWSRALRPAAISPGACGAGARLRSHETEIRDGSHGLLVWGLSVLVGALLASWTAAGAVNKTADAAAGLVSASAQGVITAITSASNPLGYITDTMFRGAPTTPAPTSTGAGNTRPDAPHRAGRSHHRPQCSRSRIRCWRPRLI